MITRHTNDDVKSELQSIDKRAAKIEDQQKIEFVLRHQKLQQPARNGTLE